MPVSCGHCQTKHPTPYDVYLCSRNARNSQRRMSDTVSNAPVAWAPVHPWSAPHEMIAAIRPGRYAVDVGVAAQRVIFIRISHPIKGIYKDTIKVQTQHAEKLRLDYVWWPRKGWTQEHMSASKKDLDKALTIACVNPLDAALLYATELNRCARCGTELTDERSRWNGIGPECEEHWPDFLVKVEEEKGVYGR